MRRSCAARFRRSRPPARRRTGGFTLLEILLALGLAVVLLATLGMVTQIAWKATRTGREDIVRGQLARAILRRMADDVRVAVWHVPEKIDALPKVSTTTSNSAGAAQPATPATPSDSGDGQSNGGGQQPPGGGQAPASGSGNQSNGNSGSGSSSSASGSNSDSSGQSQVQNADDVEIPGGIYGEEDFLEVNVPRLPRTEEFSRWYAGQSSLPPTDVRTVRWMLGQNRASTPGLYRVEYDRAAYVYSPSSIDAALVGATPLAPEVTGLSLSYFDGSEWLGSWDSSSQEGLPLAVKIAIQIGATNAANTGAATGTGGYVYQVIVHPLLSGVGSSSGSSSSGSSSDSGSNSNSQSSSGSSGSGGGNSSGGSNQGGSR